MRKNIQPVIFVTFLPYLVKKRSCVGVDGPENHIPDNRAQRQPQQCRRNCAHPIDKHLVHSKDRYCRVKVLMSKIVPAPQESQNCRRDHADMFVKSSGSSECKIGIPVHAFALDDVVGAIEV